MKAETADTRIMKARYKNYLKRYYAELLEQKERGAFIPDMEHFLRELRALPEYNPSVSDKIAVNA